MPRSRSLVASLTAAVTLAACSDASAPADRRALSLSFSTRPVSAASRSLLAAASADSQAVTITKAQIVLREIKLEGTIAGACADDRDSDTDSDGGCGELELGPVLVDLPLTGVQSALDVRIPAGRYHEMELELHKPGRQGRDAAFVAANPAFQGVSVRVEGSYGGRPFVFTSAASAEMELEFDPPVVVDSAANNVTIGVDVGTWFRDARGAVLAPTDPANAGRIAANIRASFRAFDDDDRDGRRKGRDD